MILNFAITRSLTFICKTHGVNSIHLIGLNNNYSHDSIYFLTQVAEIIFLQCLQKAIVPLLYKYFFF